MTLDDLLRNPWFYRSPGPLSLVFYGVVVVWGAHVLRKRVTYKKWGWLNSLTESFFLNGFIVLTCDVLWMSVSAIKFLPTYPEGALQVFFVFARDFACIVLCFLLVSHRLLDGVICFKESTAWAYFTLIVYLVAVFGFAQSPVQTDWTYAIRQGASTSAILTSLVFSYGLGKLVSVVLIWSWWRR